MKFNSICPWLITAGPQNDIVVSSRVRLARNVAGFNFGSSLDDSQKQILMDKLHDRLCSDDICPDADFINIQTISDVQKEMLVERHIISTQLAGGKGPRAVVVSKDETMAAMINEEDHLRIQALCNGLQLEKCFEIVNDIDDKIEQEITYAFTPDYGYLTACPTNLGTAMRVSVMLHLPGLKITGQIEKILNTAKQTDLAVRGLFGEGTEAIGDFFQLSNQVTLGVTEQQLLNNFSNNVVPQIVDYERKARQSLMQFKGDIIDDRIQRALAILKNARLISSQEALFLLSNLRFGIALKRITDIPVRTVNELFLLTQPGHLQLNAEKTLDPESRDALRAQMITNALACN